MAGNNSKQAAAQRARKKVKKVVTEGIAHVHASFNNTIITITDRQATPFRRLPPALRASRVPASPPRSLLRLLRTSLARPLLNTVLRTSKSAFGAPVPAANPRFALSMRSAFV